MLVVNFEIEPVGAGYHAPSSAEWTDDQNIVALFFALSLGSDMIPHVYVRYSSHDAEAMIWNVGPVALQFRRGP